MPHKYPEEEYAPRSLCPWTLKGAFHGLTAHCRNCRTLFLSAGRLMASLLFLYLKGVFIFYCFRKKQNLNTQFIYLNYGREPAELYKAGSFEMPIQDRKAYGQVCA